MEYVVRDAPDGIRAQWFVSDNGDVLIIEVSPQLNKFSRRQYIDAALDEYGIEPGCRRRLLPVLPVVGGSHAAGHSNALTTTAVAGTGAVAVGIAAVILPTVLHHSDAAAHRRPTAAAPAPTGPATPGKSARPPATSPRLPKPSGSAQPVAATVPSTSAVRTPVSVPIRRVSISLAPRTRTPGIPTRLPKVPAPAAPKPPPVTTGQPSPVLAVALPVAGAQVQLGARPLAQIRIGKGQP